MGFDWKSTVKYVFKYNKFLFKTRVEKFFLAFLFSFDLISVGIITIKSFFLYSEIKNAIVMKSIETIILENEFHAVYNKLKALQYSTSKQ